VHHKACGSAIGASFKGDLRASLPDEELLLTFGKHLKLGPANALRCVALYEEAAAVAGDF
jgi:hypothetical protein